ncbi:MAG: DUF4834 family protein [Leeuwenhoekiella sp.]
MKFLQTILIILLLYFAFRIIFRLAAPYVMRYVARKAGERFQQMGRDFANSGKSPKEPGKTTVESASQKKRQSNKTVGEYIDYEEIE